ncbi:MAG: DUF4240 domain-containing protein, partial [Oscillospiraceae bacterium]|nr:DUF4240 domain-containing protein [Oscillospiraceae bacterium]
LYDILHVYLELADQYGLWSAATILCDGCSDDGFLDFRAWLIAQGKEVYLAALKDPDSLADIEPYGWCQFEELTYVGTKTVAALTGHCDCSAMAPNVHDALAAELEQDIVYGKGIGYPYAANEIAGYLPRLCAKHLSPEDLARMAESDGGWNLNNEEVQAARAAGPQNAAVRRPTLQSVPKAKVPEASAPHDIEQIITDMRKETIHQIQQDREFPEGQLAWYWGYLGALDMAQKLGLITDARCQALCHEAEGFKPNCVVIAGELEPQVGPAEETTIGDIRL